MAENDFVMDNSIAMRLPLPNEARPEIQQYAKAIVEKLVEGAGALVPNLWHVEAASVLVKAEKRGLIKETTTIWFFEQFAAFELETDNRLDNPGNHCAGAAAQPIRLRCNLPASGYPYQPAAGNCGRGFKEGRRNGWRWFVSWRVLNDMGS